MAIGSNKARQIARRSKSVLKMLNIRTWHSYIGVFIAPSVIFFALTGALQLFSLHEAHDGYQPPALIEKLGRVHKDQVFAIGRHHRPPAMKAAAGAKANPAPSHEDDSPKIATTLLKWFFLAVALGLAASTVIGVWIALTRPRGMRITMVFLIAGAVIPVVLLLA